MKLYLAVIGQTCAGKETVFRLATKEYGGKLAVSIHHFSDPLNEILDLLGLEKSRPSQQGLSTDLRKRFGEDLLGNSLFKRALSDPADIVFLDGVRRPKDIEMLKKLPNSYLIYIYAPLVERYIRLKKRADRPGDAEKTWEQFKAEQSAEAESLIETLRSMADFEFDNSADDPKFKALRAQVVAIINEKLNLVDKGGADVA